MLDDMSAERELPDDVQLWPKDPERLLGISSNASRTELRRAFTRLVKRFKPEHAPEAYHRLREAYERLDRQRSVGTDFQNRDDEGAASSAHVQTPHQLQHVRNQSGDQSDRPGHSDRAWQFALDGGDLTDVYSKLTKRVEQQQANVVDFARLYWLRLLRPDLDPSRNSGTWLVHAVRDNQYDNRLLSILDAEARRCDGNFPEILADGLFHEEQTPQEIYRLAEIRWYCARRLNRFDLIQSDFDGLSRRFIDETHLWPEFLDLAWRSVLLTNATEFLIRLKHEFDSLPASVMYDSRWDRLGFDVSIHHAVIRIHESQMAVEYPQLLHASLDLIQSDLIGSPKEQLPAVFELCRLLVVDLQIGLIFLSHVDRSILQRLAELFKEYLDDPIDPSADTITESQNQELHHFMRESLHKRGEDDFNVRLFNYCIQEDLSLRAVSEGVASMRVDSFDGFQKLSEDLAGNLALGCLLTAYRLLWTL